MQAHPIPTWHVVLAVLNDKKLSETHGYNHWASGRLDQLHVHTVHPCYCHIRASTTPSMKPGCYHVYLRLCREGEVASIDTATCECAAG